MSTCTDGGHVYLEGTVWYCGANVMGRCKPPDQVLGTKSGLLEEL